MTPRSLTRAGFRWTALALGFALFLPACHWGKRDLRKSVVKVYSTIQNVDFSEPWKPGTQVQLEGCGCVVPGGMVLTTSHLINKANYIELQKFGDAKRYVAKVAYTGYDFNLALLTVDDPEFKKTTIPVEYGKLPSPGDKVTIHGGEELSIKDDTLSGMDMVWSSETNRVAPTLLTNEDINPKIYGCPVFKDGKLIGIPFETWHKSEKKGSLIPINVIERFFRGIQTKPYVEFPDTGVTSQELENPSLHGYYKAGPDQTGVVVTKVLWNGSGDGFLKEGDVITAIDGHDIDNEGYINLPNHDRVNWEYQITFYLVGEKVKLEVVRAGQALKVEMPLKPLPKLVVYREDNRNPTWFMAGGLVFVPLTGNYMQMGNWQGFKPGLKDLFFHGFQAADRKEVVLLSHILPHDVNIGYSRLTDAIVTKVNGRKIGSMKDLVEAFNHPDNGHHVIEIDDHAWFGSTIALDAAKTLQATKNLMAQFQMTTDRSPDLK